MHISAYQTSAPAEGQQINTYMHDMTYIIHDILSYSYSSEIENHNFYVHDMHYGDREGRGSIAHACICVQMRSSCGARNGEWTLGKGNIQCLVSKVLRQVPEIRRRIEGATFL